MLAIGLASEAVASASAVPSRSSTPDLIVIPILDIYRRYYGRRMTPFLAITFFAAMAGAGYLVELHFGALGLVPEVRRAEVL